MRPSMHHETPRATTRRHLAPIVGRGDECRAAQDEVARGGGVVWTGGPGAGKSHLLDHVAARLAEQGTVVLRAARHGFAGGPGGTAGSAAARPAAVLVDDLDTWPASARAALLGRLARDPHHVLLATMTDATATGPLPTGVDVRLLGPLGPLETVELLALRTAAAVAPNVAAVLAAATAGVPGALLEAVPLLSREQLRGLALLPEPLPVVPAVRRACEVVTADLDESTARLLLHAALAATDRVDVLLRAVGADVEDVLRGAAAHLLVSAGTFRLLDPRLAAYLHHRADQRTRAEVHTSLATACDAVGMPHEAVWHRARGSPAGDPALAGPLVDAGRVSLRHGDAVRAQRIGQEALGHAPQGQRQGALEVAARAAIEAGHLLDARAVLTQALCEAEGAGKALGRRARAAAVVVGALLSGRLPSEADGGAGALVALLRAEHGDVTGASGTVYTADDDPALVHLARALGALGTGEPSDALDHLDRLEALAPSGFVRVGAVLARVLALTGTGSVGAARGLLTQLDGPGPVMDAVGPTPLRRAYRGLVEVVVDLASGDLVAAREAMHAVAWETPVGLCGGGAAALLAGRIDVLVDGRVGQLAEAFERLRPLPLAVPVRLGLLENRAMSLLLGGEAQSALTLGALTDGDDAGSCWDWLPRLTHPEAVLLVGTGSSLEKGDGAPPVPCTGLDDGPDEGPEAVRRVRRAVALLGRGDGPVVDALLEAARRTGNPLEQALASVVVGRCLQRHGPSTEGAAHLRTGADMLARCGAHALAALASGRLDEAGRTGGGGGAPSAAEGLTAREVQVARSVAEGDTNRLVARRLGLSERTVEVHLTSIFRKLGVTSRTELALVVVNGGLSRR